MQQIFQIAVTFSLLSCFSFGLDDKEGFSVDCGSGDVYTWTMISCWLPQSVVDTGYVLNVVHLNDDGESGEKMEKIDLEERTAWCTFPKVKDEPNFIKGKKIQLHIQIPGLYMLALTDPESDVIVGRDFRRVKRHECGNMKLDPAPYADIPNQARVEIKVDFDGCDLSKKVTWEMTRSFFLFDDERNCFNLALIGELDMAAFLSLDSFEPGEVQTVGNILPISMFGRPFGITFFTAKILTDDEKTITLSTFLSSVPIEKNITRNEVTIIFNPFPNIKFIWYAERALTLDASRSFSRQLTPVSGFAGNSKPFLRFHWFCDGGAACDKFPPTDEVHVAKVRVPGNLLKGGDMITVELTVQLIAQDNRTVLFSRTETKIIEVMQYDYWPRIELRCVFECYGPSVMRSQTRLVRFHCPVCDLSTLTIRWLGCDPEPCLVDDVYYAVPKEQEEVYLEVTNPAGNKIKFGHRYNLLTEAEEYEFVEPTTETRSIDILVCVDVRNGVEELDHPVLYRYMYIYDANSNVVWSSTFHQRVTFLPSRIRRRDQIISGSLPLHEYYIYLDRRFESDPVRAKSTSGTFEMPWEDDEIEYTWDFILDESLYTHNPVGWVYIFTNYLKNAVNTGIDKPKIYEQMMDFLLERKLTHTDAGIIQATFRELMTPDSFSPSELFMSKYLDVWRAMMKLYIRRPVTMSFLCKPIESVSEMLNSWFRARDDPDPSLLQAEATKFIDSVILISRHHNYIDYEGMTCDGINWFMIWTTKSFHFGSNFMLEFPGDHKCFLQSIKLDKWAIRRSMKHLPSGFVDYENYISIYSIARPMYFMVKNLIPSQTILIESFGRWNNERQHIRGTKGIVTLNIRFQFFEVQRKFLFLKVNVEGNRITESDCLMMQIPVKSRHKEVLILFFPEDFQFYVAYTIVSNLRDKIDFMLGKRQWKMYEGETLFQLPLKSEAFTFRNPFSFHFFLIKGKNSKQDINGQLSLNLSYAAINAQCLHWNERYKGWDHSICSTEKYRNVSFGCKCTRLHGCFSPQVKSINNKVDVEFDDRSSRPDDIDGFFLLFFILILWLIYIALLLWARRRDHTYQNSYRTYTVSRHFDPSDRYRFLICVQMSSLFRSEINSRAFLILVGSETTSGEMILGPQNYFSRGSECWFLMSSSIPQGNIKGCVFRLEYPDAQSTWRLREIDVYSIEMEKMYVLPFTKTLSNKESSWYFNNPRELNDPVPRGLYVVDWFKKCIWSSHMILSLMYPKPGAHSLVCDVTRLHCIVLTSIFVALVFLFTWPALDGVIPMDDTNVFFILLCGFPVFIVSIILYIFLILCSPSKKWHPIAHGRGVPSSRVVGNRPSLEQEITRKRSLVSQRPSATNLSYTFSSSLEDENPLRTIVSDLTMSQNTDEPNDSQQGFDQSNSSSADRPVDDEFSRAMRISLKESSVDIIPEETQTIDEDTDDLISSLGDEPSNQVQSLPLSVTFTEVDSQIDSVSDEDEWEKGKKRRKRIKSIQRKTARLELPDYDSIWLKILYNIWIALVIGFMLAISYYLAIAGYTHKLSLWDVLTIGAYAGAVLISDFFILSPLFIFIVALTRAIVSRRLYIEEWAKKRADGAEKTVYFWKELERFGYKEKAKTVPVYEYKTKLDAHHTMLVMTFLRDKLTSITRQVREKYKKAERSGGFGLILFIIVFIILTTYHTKVTPCFHQKTFVYNSLGLPNLDRHIIKRSLTIDGVWDNIEKVFRNIERKQWNIEIGLVPREVESFGIKQLRVKPYEEHCLVGSKYKELNFPRKRCQHELGYGNEETRNFAGSWKNVAGKNTTNTTKTNEIEIVDSAFKYRPSYWFEYIYSGNTDGYYFVPTLINEDFFDNLVYLRNASWIDENTRLIMMEFSIFNINNGIASAVQILFEFHPHGIFLSSTCSSFPLTFRTNEYLILVVALFILAILTVHSFVVQIQQMNHLGKAAYWSSINYVSEFLSTINSAFLLLMFAFRYYLTGVKMDSLMSIMFGSDKAIFITLQDLANVVFIVDLICSSLAFVILLKILKMASHVKRLNVMLCLFYDVFGLFIGPLIAIVATAIALMIKFNSLMFYFKNLYRAMTTTSQFIISPLKIHTDIREYSRIIGPVLILIQWFLFLVVIVNAFVVAINEDYSVKNSEAVGDGTDKNTLQSTYELILNICGLRQSEEEPIDFEKEEENKNKKMDDDFIEESMITGFIDGDINEIPHTSKISLGSTPSQSLFRNSSVVSDDLVYKPKRRSTDLRLSQESTAL